MEDFIDTGQTKKRALSESLSALFIVRFYLEVLRKTSGAMLLGMLLPETGESTKPAAMRERAAARVGTTPVNFTVRVFVPFAGSEVMLQIMRLLLGVRVLGIAVVPLAAVNSTFCKVPGQKTSPITFKLLSAALVLLRMV